MRTRAILLQTLCVPCHSHCRYCLLSWDGHTLGADYERSEEYAKQFYEWVKDHRPDLSFSFSFGYSMDHPSLLRAIDFMRLIGSPGGEFLQFDGMSFRDDGELKQLMSDLVEHGVKQLNFTFYGEPAYHDRFAGRSGDFRLMLRSVEAALYNGLQVSAGIPLTHENVPQVDALIGCLQAGGVEKISLFVPHEEGRGVLLHNLRFSSNDYELLSDRAKSLLNLTTYKTEAEWLSSGGFLRTENRALIVSLTPDNIDGFQAMGFESVIRYVEALDDGYYSVIPSLEVLANRYGDSRNMEFFGQRDLYHRYQKRFISEHALRLYDVTDERQCGSRRY